MFDLKRFRKDFKLKQSELQEILGIPQSFISKIENGKEPFPQIHYDKLCDRFGGSAVKKYKTDDEKINSINIVGDGNVSNIGVVDGGVSVSVKKGGDESFILSDGVNDFVIPAGLPKETYQKLIQIIARMKRIEDENEQLKKDKAILQEFVTFLQGKGKTN